MQNHKATTAAEWILVVGLVLLAIVTRIPSNALFGHVPSIASLTAMSFFCGANFKRLSVGFLATFLSVLLSDMFIDKLLLNSWSPFYSGWVWQYASYCLIVLLGERLRYRISPRSLVCFSILSSFLFFMLSNFGVWCGGLIYPMTTVGLWTCYIAALPFFKQALVGDLLFTFLLFYGYRMVTITFLKKPRINPALISARLF